MVIDLPLPPAQCDCTVPFATALPNSLSAHHHISRITRPVVCLAPPTPHPSGPSTQERQRRSRHLLQLLTRVISSQVTSMRHASHSTRSANGLRHSTSPRSSSWVLPLFLHFHQHQSPPPPEPPVQRLLNPYSLPSQPQPPHQTTHGIIQSACSSTHRYRHQPTPSRTMHAVFPPDALVPFFTPTALCPPSPRVVCARASVWSPLVAVFSVLVNAALPYRLSRWLLSWVRRPWARIS